VGLGASDADLVKFSHKTRKNPRLNTNQPVQPIGKPWRTNWEFEIGASCRCGAPRGEEAQSALRPRQAGVFADTLIEMLEQQRAAARVIERLPRSLMSQKRSGGEWFQGATARRDQWVEHSIQRAIENFASVTG